ncbi:MAG: hypothetical protein A2418_00235 [Candidatus Brennerbacteria bacterium RIFOXYC1_FULL_41_11]|uniref:Predicted 3'-5' exonuclease PolB-like domain-containing protein n=1 Tax=Candidatus Brennerbacteria bacterium RIFOXYD1_FULL_41_16 TaxID=1797529 RepID=A0A1G1XJV4_9BACT|nr:MAG: hypothetical protein A2391_01695 [Candidatus Brennerbacteria bacterium RIFOXYB1_FULL_41_13]OGY39664.1 MAG: hypothetical protein A2418_00235 [Candidatus Brennerbacteria bacterium RIFOXYC1_FULL_41_11]OGY40288.1 MAG: hypothetical protein A2570_03360 [Candidatus Brennerbacteria bacterium RIFOXYD1_FULL_41_16]
MNINKLVFDIETIGQKFENLDEISKELLENRFRKKFGGDEEEINIQKERLTFFPPLSEIVAIGMLNPDTQSGMVIYQTRNEETKTEEGKIEYFPFRSEKDLLQKFWELAMAYEEFITFNGRGFDVPMLLIRSAVNEIRPSKNLMVNRYLSSQPFSLKHIDLADEFGFYGAKNDYLGLHFWAKAFNISSPKSGEMTGEDVGKNFEDGKYLGIARYCMGDVFATAELYKKWHKYLRF